MDHPRDGEVDARLEDPVGAGGRPPVGQRAVPPEPGYGELPIPEGQARDPSRRSRRRWTSSSETAKGYGMAAWARAPDGKGPRPRAP